MERNAEWIKHFGVLISAIGLVVLLWTTFARPALHGDMRVIANETFEMRQKETDRYRDEQIRELRQAVERIIVRLDRMEVSNSSELQRIGATLHELFEVMKGK